MLSTKSVHLDITEPVHLDITDTDMSIYEILNCSFNALS